MGVMRTLGILTMVAAGVCTGLAGQPAVASADDKESAQQVISRLRDDGYTVNIDKIGTAPLSKCTVTNVRNPKTITQWVPYVGPGDRESTLILQVVSQSISVTLDCSR
jgi:hypothetical protein